MVVKRGGPEAPAVPACTLLADDPRFELNRTPAEAAGTVPLLGHPQCAEFCVLGGARCGKGWAAGGPPRPVGGKVGGGDAGTAPTGAARAGRSGGDHPLITVDELLGLPGRAVVLDASWVYGPLNPAGIDPRARYAGAHIPGSWFLDLAALSDPAGRPDPRVEAVAPPRPDALRAAVAWTGAGSATPLVITDMDGGCATAPLARYALLRAGYRDVRLLDGGTPAWAAVADLTAGDPRYLDEGGGGREAPAGAETDAFFADHEALLGALRDPGSAQVVDCRALAGNAGVLPPDYEGLEVPAGARVPSAAVVEDAGAGQRFRPAHELRRLLAQAGVDPARPKLATCYFGLGAAVVATAVEIAGWGGVRVHAGSLVEHAVRTGKVRPPPA
jgi:thiosulfate/3-mercaptopyruvate sulfurtransferase